ncbi:vitamin K epoxide reductase complex subunit 1-like protein 1 [Agrilus planipennis]|uniref:vitamin-K-epoxide reductase (warfarin-sensitive) n=1 Tax=Agrilus planipennis TaxID=224129 RepID=A0A7F5RKP4_AGRPL|nr:vitamin K epoxide reductase complex subunit 1-like protein 1 [Agrilus planipennis]
MRKMASTRFLNFVLTVSSIIGLGLSIYAFIVEIAIEHNRSYTPMCDISETISCTKAFKSQYGKGMGLFGEKSIFNRPNALVGMIFYSLLITFVQSNSATVNLICYFGIILSNISSLYFAYILYFKLHTLCIVCVSTYVVNFINLISVYLKHKKLNETEGEKEKSE